jgi:hypothetical protein
MDSYKTSAVKFYFFAGTVSTFAIISGFLMFWWPIYLLDLGDQLGIEELSNFAIFVIVLACALVVAGIGAKVYLYLVANQSTERMIDSFINRELQLLTRRGRNKLNLVPEQLVLADPIYLNGPSYDPKDEDDGKFNALTMIGWVLGINPLVKTIKALIVKSGTWRAKVGSDGIWRYSLMEFTIMMCDEKQIFVYFAYVDLTTGGIFHEGTHEYFYTDICGLKTDQIFIDVKNKGRKEKKILEKLSLFSSGCSHSSTYVSSSAATSIDNQFKAMRNLLREKKHESSAY